VYKQGDNGVEGSGAGCSEVYECYVGVFYFS
jgi:hypothetical protein